MPTGLLSLCLGYAEKDDGILPGVFTSVHTRFSDLKDSLLKGLLDDAYEFRNTYIAHEKQEPLDSVDKTREALQAWIQTIQLLYSVRRQ